LFQLLSARLLELKAQIVAVHIGPEPCRISSINFASRSTR